MPEFLVFINGNGNYVYPMGLYMGELSSVVVPVLGAVILGLPWHQNLKLFYFSLHVSGHNVFLVERSKCQTLVEAGRRAGSAATGSRRVHWPCF